eukprot:TRINITY_DN32771_c0_g1_i1.p2 TRINITY_DN32771_c0_g1~~TRINITY_DN32771_c0_g1_i1.p2  ORF type:complete len:133 (-),score=33.05 TRINITY_DN32771_c0_g1_i1:301-699(-)
MFFVFFFNDTATTEIYTLHIVGSVRCVQETDQRRVHGYACNTWNFFFNWLQETNYEYEEQTKNDNILDIRLFSYNDFVFSIGPQNCFISAYLFNSVVLFLYLVCSKLYSFCTRLHQKESYLMLSLILKVSLI